VQRRITEKVGSIGAVIGALACPICFPKIAVLGAAVGLGVLAPFEGYLAKGVQALFLIAFIGQLMAFRQHRNHWLLALSLLTTLLLFSGYYVVASSLLLQLSLCGLVISSLWLVIEQRRCADCEAQRHASLSSRGDR
jgi:mercuric ion transport protein